MGISGIPTIPMIITCLLQGTLCDTGIPCTFYGGKICSAVMVNSLSVRIYNGSLQLLQNPQLCNVQSRQIRLFSSQFYVSGPILPPQYVMLRSFKQSQTIPPSKVGWIQGISVQNVKYEIMITAGLSCKQKTFKVVSMLPHIHHFSFIKKKSKK